MRLIKYIFLGLTILATALWSVCAIYFGDSDSGMAQQILAAVFALYGAVTLIGLGLPGWRWPLTTAYGTLFLFVLGWWFSISPSNDRQWQKDVEKLAYATIAGDQVTVHNIRNFSYRSEFDYQSAYYTKTFDLKKLEGIDLFSIYWMGPAIAHTILSFHFGGNDYLAVSIEARKELGEGYSTIKGFFRQYEVIYIVADERDVIGLRTHYRKDPPEQVYLYRLQGPKENGRRLFMEYIDKINRLNQTPEFYNTLLDNCTTAIWLRTLVNQEHVPFSWKILLSGYVPEYLYETQRLDNSLTFAELSKRAYINERARAVGESPDFSTQIRAAIQTK